MDSTATAWSIEFFRALIGNGVSDVVVCPGSRSQALALAAAELDDRGIIRLHVVLDERAAGFLALGLAVESRRPAPVITTSGSSVANLHPAVVEAAHQGIPLIAVTADRPESIRVTGATQTTNHMAMFTGFCVDGIDVAPFTDVARASESGATVGARAVRSAVVGRGVVHINPQFEDPLSMPIPKGAFDGLERGPLPVGQTPFHTLTLEARDGIVVIAGVGAGNRAERWARELGAPLFAEVESGSHFGPHLVTDYRTVGMDPQFADHVTGVVVVGRPTLARVADSLCNRPDVEVICVTNGELVPYRPTDDAVLVDSIDVTGDPSSFVHQWAIRWARRSRNAIDQRFEEPAADVEGSLAADHASRAAFARNEAAIQRHRVTPEMLVRAVWDVTWPHDRLVFGASSLIRLADAVVPGKPLRVHSNRGVAGIDGTIATAHGIASAATASPESAHGVTRVLLGDLAALYDASSLALLSGAIQVIVANNGGGRIFDDLPVASTASPQHVERVLRTPQDVDFESLASAYRIDYVLVSTRGELSEALTRIGQPILIEVRLT